MRIIIEFDGAEKSGQSKEISLDYPPVGQSGTSVPDDDVEVLNAGSAAIDEEGEGTDGPDMAGEDVYAESSSAESAGAAPDQEE